MGTTNVSIGAGFDATSAAAAHANTLASSSAMVANVNAQREKVYRENVFKPWADEVLAGKRDLSNPPKPPLAYELATDENGFAWPALGSKPVCDMPALPADHSKTQAQLDAEIGPYHISIGKHLDGSYWAAQETDTCPSGFKTPPLPAGPDYPEGSVFQKVGFFMGKGWWLKV